MPNSRTLLRSALIEKRACSSQTALFMSKFGESVEITEDLCEKVASEFDFDWAARNLLTAPAYAEYERVTAPAYAEYERVTAPVYAEYERVRASAYAEYERVRASAYAEYERARDAAYAEYQRARASAYAEYERVRAPAEAEYQRLMDAAYAEYERVRAIAFANLYINDTMEDTVPSQTKIFTLRAPIMDAYRGEANGYVSIPVENPLHGKDYGDDVFRSVSVHGGLTWSSLAKELRGVPSDIDPESWVVGFDTSHYGDNCSKWPLSEVIREAESLRSQIDAITEELSNA